jgi:rhodanese-related sulfurtransferase
MRRLLVLLSAVYFTLSCEAQLGSNPADSVRKVTAEELHAAIAAGDAVVIDVRGTVPYDLNHIDGAISMPLGLVAARAEELPKEKLIVAYCTCKAEELSADAALALEKAGFKRTAALKGGLAAWKAAGYKVSETKREAFEIPFEGSAAAPAAAPAAEPAAAGGGRRLAPPAAVACDRNHLTSFEGVVSTYARKKGTTRIVVKTDDGTVETFTFPTAKRAGLEKSFLLGGEAFAAADWKRIEVRDGVLAPGTRAIVWVCSAPSKSTLVDWRPAEGR